MFVLLDWWSTFTTIFLSIFCEAFPFLALGSALAAAVHLFVPEKAIAKILGKKGIGRYLAASLGPDFSDLRVRYCAAWRQPDAQESSAVCGSVVYGSCSGR